jgi:DNA gyrase subunit B
MSVVAALSEWLVHTNRRTNGSWEQTYERGVPVADLTAVDEDFATVAPGPTGTTVHFRPDPTLVPTAPWSAVELGRLITGSPLTDRLSVSILIEPSTIAEA